MKNYEKPIVLANNELSEGVYAASGTTDNGFKCDSIYIKDVWQEPDYSQWATGEQRGYNFADEDAIEIRIPKGWTQ